MPPAASLSTFLPALLLVALVACASPEPAAKPATAAPRPSVQDAAARNADTPRKYIVMLEGRNFILASGGQARRFGFTTTRDVVASSPEEAAASAIQSVLDDEKLYGAVRNDPADPPRVTSPHQTEVESFESNRRPNLDYIFYADRDTR